MAYTCLYCLGRGDFTIPTIAGLPVVIEGKPGKMLVIPCPHCGGTGLPDPDGLRCLLEKHALPASLLPPNGP